MCAVLGRRDGPLTLTLTLPLTLTQVGLVPRLVANLFVAIGTDVRNVYTVRASFVQIYNEQVQP